MHRNTTLRATMINSTDAIAHREMRIQHLKTLVEAGQYFVCADEIASAILNSAVLNASTIETAIKPQSRLRSIHSKVFTKKSKD